jgi:hypothetical protein
MVALVDLWLPIVLSAAAVWVASALAWMALPHHKGDFRVLPDEDALLASLRPQNLAPGVYAFPECKDHSRLNEPEFKAKLESGPAGMLNVWPAGAYTKMGGKMLASFVFYLVTSVFVAYVASRSLEAGAGFASVFQIAGTCAIMAYCLGRIPHDIWFNTPRRAILTNLADGIAFGLITGALFAWLWPAA